MIDGGPIYREYADVTNSNNFQRFNFPTGCDSPAIPCVFDTCATVGYVMQLQTLVYDRLLIPRGYSNALRFIRVVLQPHDSADFSYYAMPGSETLGSTAFEAGLSVSYVEGLLFETQV